MSVIVAGMRVSLAAPAAGVTAHGGQLFEHPVAVCGEWVKGGRHFSISADDLGAMVRNFDKRKNEMLVIDYEHASEQPEVARGGPVPAAGWIHSLTANGCLTARTEWTPDAIDLIKRGQYRFFSPSIDFGARDKETGEPQGATLTSGALTNHPFLEELPALQLSERSDGAVVALTDTHARLSANEEINGAMKRLMNTRGLSAKTALRVALRDNPALAARREAEYGQGRNR